MRSPGALAIQAKSLAARVRRGEIDREMIDEIALTGDSKRATPDDAHTLVLVAHVLGIDAKGLCRIVLDELARSPY